MTVQTVRIPPRPDPESTEADLRFGILGPPVVWDGDGDSSYLAGREARLLAALLLRPGHSVWRDQLIDAVWGDALPKSPYAALHNVVYRLRRILARVDRDEHLVECAAGYTLRIATLSVDATRFELMTRSASPTDPAQASSQLSDALALWRGSALEGITGNSPHLTAEALRLEALRMITVERQIEADLALGRHRGLIPQLRVLTAEWPHRENLWGYFMIALYRSGQQREALHAYRTIRDELIDQVGQEPGPWLQDIELAILDHDDPRLIRLSATG